MKDAMSFVLRSSAVAAVCLLAIGAFAPESAAAVPICGGNPGPLCEKTCIDRGPNYCYEWFHTYWDVVH